MTDDTDVLGRGTVGLDADDVVDQFGVVREIRDGVDVFARRLSAARDVFFDRSALYLHHLVDVKRRFPSPSVVCHDRQFFLLSGDRAYGQRDCRATDRGT